MDSKLSRRNILMLFGTALFSLSPIIKPIDPLKVLLNQTPIEQTLSVDELAEIETAYQDMDDKFNIPYTEPALVLLGKEQKMYLVQEEQPQYLDFMKYLYSAERGNVNFFDFYEGDLDILKSYSVSTGIEGFGRYGTMTPLGIHRIKEKIGEDTEIGRIFIGRQPAGMSKIYPYFYDASIDYITTRIMWLEGLEDINIFPYSTYIYIHGTPEEGLIGRPVSHGCIRMENQEVIELFDIVKEGTYINITN